MSKGKEIDYLFEDPPIPSQRYALVTIIGPHMPQKCDVWGLKVRGTAETIDKARAMAQKLMRVDDSYDVYTVEVGKFFPLNVEPTSLNNIEYQNSQLNALVKNYLENKELANEHWVQRKNAMVKEAIREGKEQEALANKPEHPIAVLQRIRSLEEIISAMTADLEENKKNLQASKEKFDLFTEEERALANKELLAAIENNVEPDVPSNTNSSVDEIRQKLMTELQAKTANGNEESQKDSVDIILSDINAAEQELEEITELLATLNADKSPKTYAWAQSNKQDVESKLAELKSTLQQSDKVNAYINAQYNASTLSSSLQTNI